MMQHCKIHKPRRLIVIPLILLFIIGAFIFYGANSYCADHFTSYLDDQTPSDFEYPRWLKDIALYIPVALVALWVILEIYRYFTKQSDI